MTAVANITEIANLCLTRGFVVHFAFFVVPMCFALQDRGQSPFGEYFRVRHDHRLPRGNIWSPLHLSCA